MPYANPKSEQARKAAKERHARWREKNRDVLRERNEQFRRDNPTYMREYHADHKDERRQRDKARESAP